MRKLTLALLMLTLVLNSCTKKGDTGPQGPQGNANVHGGSATVNFTWDAGNGYGIADMTDDDITQNIVDYGAVAVFRSNGSGGWISLPYTDYTTTGLSFSYYFVYTLNAVRIYYSQADLGNSAMPTSATFKVVAIAASQKQANPNTNWNNYDEVMAATKQKQ